MLTLFSWGYWGWGNATRELIRVVDATERKKGFKPPIFFDIRYSRSVRAVGFRGDAFERLLPKGRYRWFRRLGNTHIATGEPGARIADPFSAKILLEEALTHARDDRRIIFFCACPFPRFCHRHIVAKLVLEEAQRLGRNVEVVEWPGGAPIRKSARVEQATYDAVSRGLVNVPLNRGTMPRDIVSLPWGSIVDIRCKGASFPIVSGPANFQDGWSLPIWERCDAGTSAKRLRALSGTFRERNGLEGSRTLSLATRRLDRPKALTIRQPWAHAILDLGKDVENRSWRAQYKGPILIHASARPESDPRRLLAEHMATPPSQKELEQLPTGSIVGVADLFDYVKDSKSKWAERGDWHWLLRNVRPIRPVQCTGRLGLWTPSTALMRRMPKWVQAL